MPLCPTRALSPADRVAEALRALWPGAVVASTRTLYGPRVRAEVVHDGVALTVDLHHGQGGRQPVALTTVRAGCVTRGLVMRVMAARSIPSSWTPWRPPRPSLQDLGVIAAPTQCVATLLDAVTLDALAAVGANPDAYLTLTVERDGVELSLYGWPGDPSAAAHLAGIVARVARAVETAVAAAGGDFHAHPEVHALAAWDARRKRIARGGAQPAAGMG